jgi:cyanophycinase-like exopeptidase
MVMGAALADFPRFWHTRLALNLAPGLMIIPHFDELPKMMLASLHYKKQEPIIVGVDGSTGLIGYDGNWTVYGRGRVTVFEEKKQVHYTAGQQVQLPLPPRA